MVRQRRLSDDHILAICIFSFSARSFRLEPENCTETVSIIDQPQPQLITVYVPSGTVCLKCIIDGVLATNATFQILNSPVSPSDGTVVNGTLVVFDSESLFSTATVVRCSSGTVRHQATVEHSSKFL